MFTKFLVKTEWEETTLHTDLRVGGRINMKTVYGNKELGYKRMDLTNYHLYKKFFASWGQPISSTNLITFFKAGATCLLTKSKVTYIVNMYKILVQKCSVTDQKEVGMVHVTRRSSDG
jgi:hypothetical protein